MKIKLYSNSIQLLMSINQKISIFYCTIYYVLQTLCLYIGLKQQSLTRIMIVGIWGWFNMGAWMIGNCSLGLFNPFHILNVPFCFIKNLYIVRYCFKNCSPYFVYIRMPNCFWMIIYTVADVPVSKSKFPYLR